MTKIWLIRALCAVLLRTGLSSTRLLRTAQPVTGPSRAGPSRAGLSSAGLSSAGLSSAGPSCAGPLRAMQSRPHSMVLLLALLLWQTTVFAGSPNNMLHQAQQATANTSVTIVKTVASIPPSVASRVPLIMGTNHTDIKMPVVLCINTDLTLHTLGTVRRMNLTGVNTLATLDSKVTVVRHSEHCAKTDTAVLIKITNIRQAPLDQFVGELAITVTAH